MSLSFSKRQAARTAAASVTNAPNAEVTLLKEVLNNLPQAVLMFDADGLLQFINKQYLATYGYTATDVYPGLSVEELTRIKMDVPHLTPQTREFCADLAASMRRGESRNGFQETLDGRSIHYIYQPMQSGGWVVTHEDVTSQRQAEARIEHMAMHDALTGLPNRISLRAHLEQALRIITEGKQLSVMFLDLDNFKSTNDTLGHQVGDELLKIVSARLQTCMRSTDIVARLGGDEFVIVSTPLDNPSEAEALAARIRKELLKPFDLHGHEVTVDTSIGISMYPADGTEAGELLKNADLALYSAKGSGRGTHHFFENAMNARMTERRNLELELRAGFVNGEFEIFYQPLINLESGEVTTCEALLRWDNPKLGSVSPQTFIPIAEEIGLISRLGEWVIRAACAEAVNWPSHVTLAVNISPVQFRSQNLVQIITHALAFTGLAPKRLEIEITEALLLEQTDATLKILNQLRSLGVRVAMDDFGTGYSSLSYLQKFPFDKIKIDQTFIRGLSAEGEACAIVRAVTGLAGTLKMVTTAEGVETEEQRTLVTALGCTEMQGFLFSAAQPAHVIRKMLTG